MLIKTTEYYDNGSIKGTGIASDGIKEGQWLFYHQSGKLWKKGSFQNGDEDSLWTIWHENGHIHLEYNMTKGVIAGISKEYYENGRIKQIAEYIDGEYFLIDFWDEKGNQTLKNGTGKKVEAFGNSGLDVYEQFFVDGKFIKEAKISSVNYGNFVAFKKPHE